MLSIWLVQIFVIHIKTMVDYVNMLPVLYYDNDTSKVRFDAKWRSILGLAYNQEGACIFIMLWLYFACYDTTKTSYCVMW